MLDRQVLYTEKMLVEITALSRPTIRREMAKGNLRAVHIGRSIRFPASEVERFLTDLNAAAGIEVE